MRFLLLNPKLNINDKIYLKDPETSALGKKILQQSILLIDEIGFEAFTFKKLGERIESNESSVYRYFENKHKLLLYFSSWYWSWIEFRLVFGVANLTEPVERLKRTIITVTEDTAEADISENIDVKLLKRIIIHNFMKTFLTKEVDEEIRSGFFQIYTRVIQRVTDVILENAPTYAYAESLASTIVEGALHQHFLKSHLQDITSCNNGTSPTDFYLSLTDTILKQSL
jgi:AcrR family transcriptional regulator